MIISVIIPVYNEEIFLRECLDSVRACPSSEMECIIVNDGSTDGSADICRSLVSEDVRFRMIEKKNTGVSDSRNIGVAEAVGKYVFFLDADDYIDITRWSEILEEAENNESDMIAFGYYSLFDSGNTKAEQFPDDIDIKYALLSTPLLNACWGKLLRREVIKEHNILFRKGMKTCEDAIFVLDFACKAKSFAFLNNCVLYYRIHREGIMQKASPEDKLLDFAKLFSRRKEYLENNYNERLKKAMYRDSFSVITDFFRSCAKGRHLSEIRYIYKKSINNETTKAIMKEIDKKNLSPIYKKAEFALMQTECYTTLAIYFKIKHSLTALKVRS